MEIVWALRSDSDALRDMVEDIDDVDGLIQTGQKNPSAKSEVVTVYDQDWFLLYNGELPKDQDAIKQEIIDYLEWDPWE